jgi:hypothetical protein
MPATSLADMYSTNIVDNLHFLPGFDTHFLFSNLRATRSSRQKVAALKHGPIYF